MASRSRPAPGAGTPSAFSRVSLALKVLAGLIVLLVVAFVILTIADNGSDDSSKVESSSTAAPKGPPATTASRVGTLRAGGVSLLPVPAGGINRLIGRTVSGRRLTVQSVASRKGFWVGT